MRVRQVIFHINNQRVETFIAENGEPNAIITHTGGTTQYTMHDVATTLQKHTNRDAIDALLMYLASGGCPAARNDEMFAELAYFAHSL